MEQRWNQHVSKSNKSRGGRWHFPNAIRKYGKDAFSHEVLEVCSNLEVANLAEECWIEFYNATNPEKGFNLARGGAHVPIGKCPDFMERLSKAVRKSLSRPDVLMNRATASRKMWEDQGFRDKLTQISQEVQSRPDVKMKISKSLTGKTHTDQHRISNSTAHRGKKHSAEHRDRMSQAAKALWADPEYRARVTDSTIKAASSHEERARRSMMNRGKIHNPETKAKISKSLKKRADPKS